MDVFQKAIRYSMSELARENITPDVNLSDPLPLIESELVDMVALYNGQESATEAKRLFILASKG